MANVPVNNGTSGSLSDIATLQLTRDGVTEQMQLFWEGYDISILTVRTSVSNIANQITSATPNAARRLVRVMNMGPSDYALIGPAGVTAANGFPVYLGQPQDFKLGAGIALYGIASTSTAVTFSVIEFA